MERLDSINALIKKFKEDREWDKFHNPKDLAISLSIEAAELLECFQWKTSEQSVKENLDSIKYEIADIAIYLLYLCDKLNINILDAIEEKVKINEIKYPLEKSKGNSTKYNKL
ncbi:nucleotide pyrophosphohydrolase [uncultured Fusobacterium sp.]|uniref:nucleotide pyrophosphohydrolase n=1 Tax=uncultured Fusobacterium sp. TaxID=159267 RepID=UPI002586A478|nr:nucleotide pyrophosphohydrolase [uncultured Fusobacterium sp.]